MSSNQEDQTATTQPKQQPKGQPSPTKQVPSSIPQTKKTASYTYWVDQKNKSRELPPEQRPQKIEIPSTTNQQSDNGRSQWNTAGTWEHKKISIGEIEKQYTEKVAEWLSTVCPEMKISKVSLNGECEVVFTRNKKALTYQINGKVELQKTLPAPKEQDTEVQNEKQEVNEDKERNGSDDSDSIGDSKEEKTKEKKKVKTSTKTKNLTLEITDLTDSGDRDHTVKADTPEDKKWIAGQSNKLLSVLEDILKSYK